MEHKDKPVVYVCAPFRAPTQEGIEENIQKAVDRAAALAMMGYYPVTPHLLGVQWPDYLVRNNDQFWLDFTMEVMRRCDVVYCEGCWKLSRGCIGEVREATELGIPTVRTPAEAAGFLTGWESREKYSPRRK